MGEIEDLEAQRPEVSIVVPVWGGHVGYLCAAVDSLVEQTGPSCEIVVVDNASEEPVPELDGCVRLIHSPERLPVGRARNLGLRHAAGCYVMFWDADDLLLPGALARMWSVLKEDPALVAVTMDSVRWTPESGPGVRWPWPRSHMYSLARHRHAFAAIALLYNPFTTTGPALMRTDAVRDAGGFAEDVPFYEDWALAGSLAVRGRVEMLRETGRLYRIHEKSLTIGHLDHPEQGEWLRRLRHRARRDPSVPLWLKACLPFVHVHHWQRQRRRKRTSRGVGAYECALKELAGAGVESESVATANPQ